MNIVLTSMLGKSKTIKVNSRKDVEFFVQEFPKRLPKSERVHIACDVLGVTGWVSGEVE